MKRLCRIMICAGLLLGPALPAIAQPTPSADEFVPMSEVPPSEQVPALTLVASAYGFVWVVLVGYLWSLTTRLKKVEQEIGELEERGR